MSGFGTGAPQDTVRADAATRLRSLARDREPAPFLHLSLYQPQSQQGETTMSIHAPRVAGTNLVDKTRWAIDPARSRVEFRSKTFWGAATVKGQFARYHGTLDLRREPAIDLTIEADSLDTKNKKRDEHLRSPDFFGAENHPYVRFVSEGAVLDGERLRVRGTLHARGSSMPLLLQATLRVVGDELELEAVTDANHHELGMTWNKLGMLRTPSELIVKGRLVRDAD
jgi:polyisoprenoid-binding protein YceI